MQRYAFQYTVESPSDSVHAAPFWHGLLAHSSASRHRYVSVAGRGSTVPFCSVMVSWGLHSVPVGHLLTPQFDSTQVSAAASPLYFASCPHALLAHSSTSWHVLPSPVHPTTQAQSWCPGPRCEHTALIGSQSSSSSAHKSRGVVQVSPSHPRRSSPPRVVTMCAQSHTHSLAWLWQTPLFWHGLLAHSSTSTSQLPPSEASSSLSNTVHCVVYSEM